MFFRRRKQSPLSFDDRLEMARAQGFAVEPEPGAPSRFRISKLGCAAVVEPEGSAGVRFVQTPGLVIDGEIAKLLDKGYQKFLVTAQGSRPALAEQLRVVHQFDEELRRALQIPSLYNESLGTVSNRYVYDRVQGRE